MAESERPEDIRFDSSEALLRYLREKSDDVDRLTIAVPEGIQFSAPNGDKLIRRNAAAVLALCSGTQLVLHRDDLEKLLNDGLLNRMKIPVNVSTLT